MLRTLLITIFSLTLLGGCDDPQGQRVKDITQQLAGAWQRDDGSEAKTKRILKLEADGKFVENIEVTQSGQASERMEFSGEWSYDGKNLKRRFLKENGRQYSGGGMRFATFPLVSVSTTEFVVDDNIAKTRVTYRRITEIAR